MEPNVTHIMTVGSIIVKGSERSNQRERVVEFRERMRKDTRLSFRVRSDLKKKLEAIASTEGRSVAQVCEAFLSAGANSYKSEGAVFLQRLITRSRRGNKGSGAS